MPIYCHCHGEFNFISLLKRTSKFPLRFNSTSQILLVEEGYVNNLIGNAKIKTIFDMCNSFPEKNENNFGGDINVGSKLIF